VAQTSSQDASLRRPLSQFQQAMLSFYWFATNVQWSAVLIVLMPSQIKLAVGDATKGSTLGIALAIGAFMSMVIAPAFGALSDRVRLPGGRRKPWVVLGTIGNNIGLLGLAFFILPGQTVSLPLWIGAFLVVELFNNLATAPYSALIPDVVPMSQRGSASGWMGLMTVLGMFVGGLLGFLLNALGGITGVYMMLIGIMFLGALATYFGVKEPENLVVRKITWKEFLRGLYSPFQSANFTWVFLTRLLVSMGIYTIQEFLQYYMGDVIGAPYILAGVGKVADAAEQAASFFLLPLLLGAIISTLVAGILSDRFGRKLMVYLAGGLMGAVALVFIVFHSFTLAVLMGIVFGLGYGAYQSVDWALASDVLPSMDDYAKDMGVWHVAMVLPQVVATPIAGFLLDNFQTVGKAQNQPTLGYTVIFLLAVAYFFLGTVFVKQIKGVR
jgi:MFS family permease